MIEKGLNEDSSALDRNGMISNGFSMSLHLCPPHVTRRSMLASEKRQRERANGEVIEIERLLELLDKRETERDSASGFAKAS